MTRTAERNQLAGLVRTEKSISLWETGPYPARITVNEKLEISVNGRERHIPCIMSTKPTDGAIAMDERSLADLMGFITKNIPEVRCGTQSAFVGKTNGVMVLDPQNLYFARAKEIEDRFYENIMD